MKKDIHLIDISFNAYEQHLSILIDNNHNVFSKYSTIVQYLDSPFYIWAEKIIFLIYEDLNESSFRIRYKGRNNEYEILSYFAQRCDGCKSIEYVIPEVNTDQQDRMLQLNQLVKELGSAYSKTIINIKTGSFPEKYNAVNDIFKLKNRFCEVKMSNENSAFGDLSVSCPFYYFEDYSVLNEKIKEIKFSDYAFVLVQGSENKFSQVKDGIYIYEFDGTEESLVNRVFDCMMLYPFATSIHNCAESIKSSNKIIESLKSIITMNPYYSIEVHSDVEVGHSTPVELTVKPYDVVLPQLICEFNKNGILKYEGRRIYGLTKGEAVASFFIKGDLKPIKTVLIKSYTRNRINNIVLMDEELELGIGDNYSLSYTFTPEDADNCDKLCFYSENENIVKVDKSGRLQAVGAGTCRIFCSAEVISTYCCITVKPLMQRLEFIAAELQSDEIEMKVGEKINLSYNIIPADCFDFRVLFSSSNYSVANVLNMNIEAKDIGTAVITAENESKTIKKSWNIKVVKRSGNKNKTKKGLLSRLFK